MAAKELKLMVFAHLAAGWSPCGQLLMTEEGPNVLASSFAYGLNYIRRPDALEVDPVSLSLRDRAQIPASSVRTTRNFSVAWSTTSWSATTTTTCVTTDSFGSRAWLAGA